MPRPSAAQVWRQALACVALLFFACLAHAQQRAFQYLRHEQGLENLVVTALVQDAAGDLWIGTENGLYRFDGARMRRFGPEQGMQDQDIADLHVDLQGRLWVAGATMLLRREGEVFVQVRHEDRAIQVQPGQSLASTREGLVVNTRQGLLMLQGGAKGWRGRELFDAAQRQRHPEVRDVDSVAAGSDDEIWFGCAHSLCRLDRNGLRVHAVDGGATTGPVTRVLHLPDGRLWLRSETQLWELAPGAQHLHRVDLPPGEQPGSQLAPLLAVDTQGRLLTQHGSGVARWDGLQWEVIDVRQGLQAGGGVSAWLQARDGSVWLGTLGSGLAQWLGYRHARSWGRAEGLPSEDVWAFLRSRDGAMYMGTIAGLSVSRDGGALVRADPRQPAEVASSLAEDARGRIWVGSFDGPLSVYDPATRRQTRVARLPRITRSLTDRAGRLWVITHSGIFLIEHPEGEARLVRVDTTLYPPDKTQAPAAHDACLAGNGQVWISTDAGLLRGDGARLEKVELQSDDGRSLADDGLRAIACRDDRLWLGATSGLWQAPADAQASSLKSVHADVPLLRQRSVLALRFDRRGWLWLGTDYGVAVTDMNRWRFIRRDAGLPWNDCNQGALYEDDDGSIWVGTTHGAAQLGEPDALFVMPTVGVSVAVGGAPAVGRHGPAKVTLPWARRSVALSLSSPVYEERGALRFEYRMQGQDEDWRSGTATELVYPSLQPGGYRFEVRARNLDMQVASPLETLDIEVLPPWWRTAWFYSAVAVTTLMLAWGGYRWRLRRYRLRQLELELLVAERTREIEASHAQMRELALRDGLTGVLNRRALDEALAAEIARAERSRGALALVLVDADRFKRINDEHGHQAGDAVLVAITQRLQAATRPYDIIGRYGGEEFLLLLPELDMASTEGRARIEAFHQAIRSQPVALGQGLELAVTCSFGVAGFVGGRAASAAVLIASADAALYRAKENGRNRIEYAPSGLSG